MASGSRLSDVIVKLPDRSTCRVERRLIARRTQEASGVPIYVCTLPTGEPVTWLGGGKYRLACGSVGVAGAHKPADRRRGRQSARGRHAACWPPRHSRQEGRE